MTNLFTIFATLKRQYLGMLAVGMLVGPIAASGASIVDTGPGPDAQIGTFLTATQWIGGEFVITDEHLVTNIELWMWDLLSSFGFPSGGTYTVAIYADGGGVPGTELFSGEFLADNATPEWRGLSGVSWNLLPGTYWATFEVRDGQANEGVAPTPSPQPLANHTVLNDTLGGVWINTLMPPEPFAPFALNLGIRIMGQRLMDADFYLINATGTSNSTPSGGLVISSDWTLVFDDVSKDGLLQIEEIVSFSGTTVTATGGTSFSFDYDTIVGSPTIAAISELSGGLDDCCWWFTGPVTGDPMDGWFPTRWTYSKIALFSDVLPDHWAFSFIKILSDNGITSGCGNNNYCPGLTVSRAQMAVFLERGMNGSGFSPPAATGSVFGDVAAGSFAASFIEQLASDGITAGCGNGNYCPADTVTRDQMAVFLLRAEHGADYMPPPAFGIFADVPLDHWAVNWIEQLAAEGITSGCGDGNYCPEAPVKRDQMAVFLVRAFGL